MKYYSTIFLFLVSVIDLVGQDRVVGKVIFKSNKKPFAGAIVIERGTRIGDKTDLDGTFTFNVTSVDTTVLVVSSVGHASQEFKLNGQDSILIKYKDGCTKCFFDDREVTVYALSGLFNSPIGGQVDISALSTRLGTLKSSFSYQTQIDQLNYFNYQLEASHIFVSCDYDLDILWHHRNWSSESDVFSKTSSIEIINNFNKITFIGGLGRNEIQSLNDQKPTIRRGPVVGVGKFIGKPFNSFFYTKVAFFGQDLEIQGSLKYQYRRLNSVLKYYKYKSYSELSLGIGFSFQY
ncbi:MAG: carboxypeptidase-like regulatory domain-containing protein [Ekhidna sp.]